MPADIPIFDMALMDLPEWYRSHFGRVHLKKELCFSSVEERQIESRGCYGKEMAFFFCTSGWRMEDINGRERHLS